MRRSATPRSSSASDVGHASTGLRAGGADAVARGVRPLSGALFCLLAAIAVLLAPAAAPAASLKDPLTASVLSLTTGPPGNIGLPTVSGSPVQGQTLIAAS